MVDGQTTAPLTPGGSVKVGTTVRDTATLSGAGDILETLTAGGWEWGAIVNESGVLLGRVRAGEIRDPSAPASEILEEGPVTYRPNVPLDELLGRMLDKRFDLAFVTDPDGRLHGLGNHDAGARRPRPAVHGHVRDARATRSPLLRGRVRRRFGDRRRRRPPVVRGGARERASVLGTARRHHQAGAGERSSSGTACQRASSFITRSNCRLAA